MNQRKKEILIVEDEPNLAFNLQLNLQEEGYLVYIATNGNEAITFFDKNKNIDLIILDVMLPEKNGFEVAKYIRNKNEKVHILMLTALNDERNRLRGFKYGIDDYISKPFQFEELLARINRMIQRSEFFHKRDIKNEPTKIYYSDSNSIQLNFETLELQTKINDFNITALEAQMLKTFMQNANKVLSRQFLLDHVWGVSGTVETRTVDNFIVRLRRLIEIDPTSPKILVSVRSRGYQFLEDKSKDEN